MTEQQESSMTCISIWSLQSTLMALNIGYGTICKFRVYSYSKAQFFSGVTSQKGVLQRHSACVVSHSCCTWHRTLQIYASEEFLLAHFLVSSHSCTRVAWMQHFLRHMKIDASMIHEKQNPPVASCFARPSCSSCNIAEGMWT